MLKRINSFINHAKYPLQEQMFLYGQDKLHAHQQEPEYVSKDYGVPLFVSSRKA